MSKIKILHIIKSLGRGGAEMLLPETLKKHNKEDFEFHYIYFLPWKNQMVEALEEAGGKVTCFPANNNIQLLLQFPKIIRYCREHQINLIHAHLPWAGFVSRIVYKGIKIPVIYTEHNLQERYHWVTKFINKHTFNWQTLGIGVSNDVSQSILKNINPKIHYQTVVNGVNTENFQRGIEGRLAIREQYSIPDNAIVVGTVAVFRFQKRLDLWLEIISEAIKINPNLYGMVVGAGPLEKELLAKHAELQLGDRVIFTGLQTNVKPYFEAMDVFMMSSSFEGLPVALLEAMSMECAILSTGAGGVKEVIRTDKDGILVGVDEWPHLATSLNEMTVHSENLKYYQTMARKRVVESFSIDVMVNQLESCYLNHLS